MDQSLLVSAFHFHKEKFRTKTSINFTVLLEAIQSTETINAQTNSVCDAEVTQSVLCCMDVIYFHFSSLRFR